VDAGEWDAVLSSLALRHTLAEPALAVMARRLASSSVSDVRAAADWLGDCTQRPGAPSAGRSSPRWPPRCGCPPAPTCCWCLATPPRCGCAALRGGVLIGYAALRCRVSLASPPSGQPEPTSGRSLPASGPARPRSRTPRGSFRPTARRRSPDRRSRALLVISADVRRAHIQRFADPALPPEGVTRMTGAGQGWSSAACWRPSLAAASPRQETTPPEGRRRGRPHRPRPRRPLRRRRSWTAARSGWSKLRQVAGRRSRRRPPARYATS
jgi:hypothetical protein